MAHYSFWGKKILDTVCHLPLVLPPVVVGYSLLILLGPKGIVGSFLYQYFNINLAFREEGAVIACSVVSFPLLLGMSKEAWRQTIPSLREAAFSLGGSPWYVWKTICLPQALPGILSGFVLAWGRSLGEFGATITFAANIAGHTRTLPLALYTELQNPSVKAEEKALRLLFLSVFLSVFCLIVSDWLQKKYISKTRSQS